MRVKILSEQGQLTPIISPDSDLATNVADHTTEQLESPQLLSGKLTWGKSSIKQVQYNKTIEEHMTADQAFSNWVRSCVMLHSDNDAFETVCMLPDQFRSIGDEITIVTANGIPGRLGDTHKVVSGVIHVMQ